MSRTEYHRAWRAANRDLVRGYARDSYAKNRDAVLSRQAAYYAANPEKARAKSATYREKNRDLLRAKQSSYTSENPVVPREYAARRRGALTKATPVWAELDDIRSMYEVAEILSRGGVMFEVDHIVPLRSRLVCGLHVLANVQITTSQYNREKGNRFWPDMPD